MASLPNLSGLSFLKATSTGVHNKRAKRYVREPVWKYWELKVQLKHLLMYIEKEEWKLGQAETGKKGSDRILQNPDMWKGTEWLETAKNNIPKYEAKIKKYESKLLKLRAKEEELRKEIKELGEKLSPEEKETPRFRPKDDEQEEDEPPYYPYPTLGGNDPEDEEEPNSDDEYASLRPMPKFDNTHPDWVDEDGPRYR